MKQTHLRQLGSASDRSIRSAIGDDGSVDVPRAQRLLAQLTPREREMFDLYGSGISTLRISAGLGVNRKTVEAHRARIVRKLGLEGSVELYAFAGAVRAAIAMQRRWA